jgi:hypothetical protein
MNRFNIGDRIFLLNIGNKLPLTVDFLVSGIKKTDEGIYYTEDDYSWVSEKSLFETRKEAHNFIRSQCEIEMNNPSSTK